MPQAPHHPHPHVTHLAVNGRHDNPLGVDDPTPRLSWQTAHTPPNWTQHAYQVQAAHTPTDLHAGRLLWDTGKVPSDAQTDIPWHGPTLTSRDRVVWRVRVWGPHPTPSPWSPTASWEMGLLHPDDWGTAQWIEHPHRTSDQPLPLFARTFHLHHAVTRARLHLSGIGLHTAWLNDQPVTDEVLAPGNSNHQLSVEYRTYDVTPLLRHGPNTLGVELGHGTALVTRSVTNPTTGRTAPYSWWESHPTCHTTLAAPAPRGTTTVNVHQVTGLHLGGALNIDTGDAGQRLETRTITAIGTPGPHGTGVTIHPPLTTDHPTGATVTGSGNPLAHTEPTANAALTPRLIARLELTHADGTQHTLVSDRTWRTALGPTTTANWFSGSDYDARREQPHWTAPNADLTPHAPRRDGTPMHWTAAGTAPPPNLTTRLVWRNAEPVRVVDRLHPVSIRQPQPGVWVFDFGQNIAGWPLLRLDPPVPPGTTVTLRPAEALHPDGTVDQTSLLGGGPTRGTDLFATYTAHGDPHGETWHPRYHYFGMQWLQVTGLPDGYTPTEETVTALQLRADTPPAGSVHTSDARINRLHRMARYSVESNVMSTFTDCPGREKLAYPADYLQPFGALHRILGYAAYLRTMARHLAEGQARTGDNQGNVALKAPVYDWGYTGRFGDEINWGNGIVLTPWYLYTTYGDTQTMRRYYPHMRAFLTYLRTRKAGTGTDAHLVDGALGDWIADEDTSGRITGTWGYHQVADRMARMAHILGHTDDATEYRALADAIRHAFNKAFYNHRLGRYTAEGDRGTTGATQTAQALALDEGLVPDGERQRVLNALVELVHAHHPHGPGPHLSGGTIGLGPIVRALHEGGRDDVLWEVLQQNTPPSYGHFLTPTPANPDGLTTLPEQWDLANSRNHMILAQIEEWFHAGLAGIRQPRHGVAYRHLLIDPRPVGDLTHASGTYRTPHGQVTTAWTRQRNTFHLRVHIPANTTADIHVPTTDGHPPQVTDGHADLDHIRDNRAVYHVGSGRYAFTSPVPTPGSTRP